MVAETICAQVYGERATSAHDPMRIGRGRVLGAHLALGEDAHEAVDVELAAVHLEVDRDAAQVDRLG